MSTTTPSTSIDAFEFQAEDRRANMPLTAEEVNRVYRAILEETDGDGWTGTHRLDVSLTRSKIGAALAELDRHPDCPIDLERWNRSNCPNANWRVTRAES